jgi:hypothetical protein
VDNFQKYHYLDQTVNEKKRHETKEPQPRPTSAGQRARSPSPFRNTGKETGDYEEQEFPHFSRRSRNPGISETDLLMFGMYRLNPEQEEIYKKFVEMVSEFDDFDMVSW